MPYSTLEVYELLAAGNRIRVSFESKLRYEVLRTELLRQHHIVKDLLGLSDFAVCSSFKNMVGTFHIGVPKGDKTINMLVSQEAIYNA